MHAFNKDQISLALEILTNVFLSQSQKLESGRDKSFLMFPSDKLFVTKGGRVSILRKSDNMVVLETSGDFVFGLNRLHNVFIADFLIRIDKRCDYVFIDIDDAHRIASEANAWYYISQVLSWTSYVYAIRDNIASQKSVYGSIKMHLNSIWEMDEESRAKISIYKYIMGRTTISRSAVHKIINELNFGGYINSYRGRLLELRKLPDYF